ncbi:hypothetical protein KJ809_02940 [Patescibacteria group bacterium]|nr:hypothetical protein [Patescibacteria group bacterium]
MRKELPPEPDEKLNNSTLNGIDTNNNGIRDDVEIAIFKLYPDSARIRSGALQYAKAMQMHFRKDIVNSKTFVAVLQEKSRGYLCLGSEPNLRNIKDEKIFKKLSDEIDIRLEKIYDLVFNIDIRKNKEEENYEKYMTSMGIEPGQYCDIDINLLN